MLFQLALSFWLTCCGKGLISKQLSVHSPLSSIRFIGVEDFNSLHLMERAAWRSIFQLNSRVRSEVTNEEESGEYVKDEERGQEESGEYVKDEERGQEESGEYVKNEEREQEESREYVKNEEDTGSMILTASTNNFTDNSHYSVNIANNYHTNNESDAYNNYNNSSPIALQQINLLARSLQNRRPIMIILAGIPGCGKSTFASRLVTSLPSSVQHHWQVYTQDALKTRQRVVQYTHQALRRREHVVIDRCNFDAQQRQTWISLARQYQVAYVLCVILPNHLNIGLCSQRAYRRGDSTGIHDADTNWNEVCTHMAQAFRYPKYEEGMTEIVELRNDQDIKALIRAIASLYYGT